MSKILNVYTAEQLYEMQKKKILAKGVGLTDFNEGSKVSVLLQGESDIISTVSMDFKSGIMNAIPVALYEGFGFARKPALGSTGYYFVYRKPTFTMKYTGLASAVTVTITSTEITVGCTGAPGDAFIFDFATYPKVNDLVAAIEALTNWSATAITNNSCVDLYKYNSKELLNLKTYLNEDGMDVMLASNIAVTVSSGFSVTVSEMLYLTESDFTILAGDSGIECFARNTTPGRIGDIAIAGINTIEGKGFINSPMPEIDGVRNNSAFSGGTLEETNEERRIRFQNTVNALNAGTKNGIIVAIEATPGVRSVGMRTSYPFRGINTILVDDGSGVISSELRAAVEKNLYGDPDDLVNYPGKNAEGIGYNIEAPVVQNINVGITATRLSNVRVDLDLIKNNIISAVEQYINTLPLGRDVILSEVARVAKNSNPAIYDLAIVSPGSNVSIDENELARTGAGTTGTVTVTVTISGTE